LRYAKLLQTFWQEVIKECQKENLVPATTNDVYPTVKISSKDLSKNVPAITTDVSPTAEISSKDLSKNLPQNHVPTVKTPFKDLSGTSQPNISTKNIKFNLCCDIFHELENKSYAHLFYKCVEKDVKHPMDLFTIKSKLENNQYTILEEFEQDIHLIFYNCYLYNDAKSEIYHLGEALESVFNKTWNEKVNFQNRKTKELKRVRDNNTDADTSKLL
jgi:hypothetical protein